MTGQLVDNLRCPNCADRLAEAEKRLDCQGCGLPYPVLLGHPILVGSPHEWVAAYRDAVLATLAERGAESAEVELALAFAEIGRGAEPRRFSDDWVASEVGAAVEEPIAGPALAELDALFEIAETHSLVRVLETAIDDPVELAVDVGCGAGNYTLELASRADRVIAVDTSLRAVATTCARSDNIDGIVGDLDDRLPLADNCADLVLAAHLFDVVDDSAGAIVRAARVLRPGGLFIASSPDPNLGLPELHDEIPLIDGAVVAAGLEITSVRDGVPWLRRHNGRHIEIYLTRVVVARRPTLSIA
jgi:SAM-dependent methyltransferase